MKLAHELHGASSRIDDLGCVALYGGRCVVGRNEKARVARDRGEEVVQVVRDRVQVGTVFVLPQGKQVSHVECFGRKRLRL